MWNAGTTTFDNLEMLLFGGLSIRKQSLLRVRSPQSRLFSPTLTLRLARFLKQEVRKPKTKPKCSSAASSRSHFFILNPPEIAELARNRSTRLVNHQGQIFKKSTEATKTKPICLSEWNERVVRRTLSNFVWAELAERVEGRTNRFATESLLEALGSSSTNNRL